jgi:hypothetical protein
MHNGRDRTVPTDSKRTIAIAEAIDRYVEEHPNAADTPEGVRSWWIARHSPGASLEDVQKALDYLVARSRLARFTLADGTAVYGRRRSRAGELELHSVQSAGPAQNEQAQAAIVSASRVNNGS